MTNNCSRLCVLCAVAFAVAMGVVGSPGVSDTGYLPKTGPSSLRFQAARSPTPLSLPPLPMADTNVSEVTNMPVPSDLPTPVVHYAAGMPEITPARSPMPSIPESDHPPGPTATDPLPPPSADAQTNTPSPSGPASDLLVITPQMLVDYFKPAPVPVNATNPTVLAPLRFTPAMPAGPASKAVRRTP